MGTRNVTIIKFNGEEKVRQYGQWDGYPTYSLVKIIDFLKKDGAIEKLKQNLPKCKLVPDDISIFPAEWRAIADAVYAIGYCDEVKEKMQKLSVASGRPRETIFRYLLATRDTGCQILNVLTMEEADNASEIVLQRAYTDEVDWQIEAVNVIDLDHERIFSNWHDTKSEWAFDSLPNETEIEEFEKGGY